MRLSDLDRRAGRLVRRACARVPGGPAAARGTAGAMSPLFRLIVAAALVTPRHRRAGAEALASGVAAALVARRLRDALGRRRPGDREEGGFPSRHAAAGAAISCAATRANPAAGRVLALLAAAGMLARVADAQHEPADILAGAALGAACDRAVRALAAGR